MIGEPLTRLPFTSLSQIESDLGLNLGAMVEDSMKHFYGEYLASGYKLCRCSSCKLLTRPILIRESRESHEYEQIHKAYLCMVLDDNTEDRIRNNTSNSLRP